MFGKQVYFLKCFCISIQLKCGVWLVFVFIKETIYTLLEFMTKTWFMFSLCCFSFNQFKAFCPLCWSFPIFLSFIKILTFLFIWKILILKIGDFFLFFVIIQISLYKSRMFNLIRSHVSIDMFNTWWYLWYDFLSNLLSKVLLFFWLFLYFVSVQIMLSEQFLDNSFASERFKIIFFAIVPRDKESK